VSTVLGETFNQIACPKKWFCSLCGPKIVGFCTSLNCLFNLRTDYQITQNIETGLLVEASVNWHPPPLKTSSCKQAHLQPQGTTTGRHCSSRQKAKASCIPVAWRATARLIQQLDLTPVDEQEMKHWRLSSTVIKGAILEGGHRSPERIGVRF